MVSLCSFNCIPDVQGSQHGCFARVRPGSTSVEAWLCAPVAFRVRLIFFRSFCRQPSPPKDSWNRPFWLLEDAFSGPNKTGMDFVTSLRA